MSAEDLRIIDLDDEVLRAEHAQMSFDTKQLQRRLSGDPWQMVIQSHLYVDHIVSRMLSEHLPYPKALAMDRLGLSQKLDLVAALALVESDVLALIRQVNRIRNQIAHDLEYELTDERIASIMRRVPARLERHVRADPFPHQGYDLQKVLIFLILTLDVGRQRLAGDRAVGRKMSLQVQRVAEGIRQAQSKSLPTPVTAAQTVSPDPPA